MLFGALPAGTVTCAHSTIFPSLTVNAPTENGLPFRSDTIPAAPLTSARRIVSPARDHIAATPLPRIGTPATTSRSQLFSGGYGFNACLDLAERSGGEYLGLYDLSQGAILAGVERSLRAR